MAAACWIVRGKVQGVGFRYYVLENAGHLQLGGLVRNLRNGDVEVVAEGDKGPLEALLMLLERGPRGARVDRVHSVWLPATGEFASFRVADTR